MVKWVHVKEPLGTGVIAMGDLKDAMNYFINTLLGKDPLKNKKTL
jgi:hypothetical protein